MFICLFLQAEQAVQGEEMLATAALFVKLDSAKNLPVGIIKVQLMNGTIYSNAIQ